MFSRLSSFRAYRNLRKFCEGLRELLAHVGKTLLINRASRSHATKVKREGGSGGRGSPVGSRPRVADLSKMVPKMNPHFTCLGGRFWGFKMV